MHVKSLLEFPSPSKCIQPSQIILDPSLETAQQHTLNAWAELVWLCVDRCCVGHHPLLSAGGGRVSLDNDCCAQWDVVLWRCQGPGRCCAGRCECTARGSASSSYCATATGYTTAGWTDRPTAAGGRQLCMWYPCHQACIDQSMIALCKTVTFTKESIKATRYWGNNFIITNYLISIDTIVGPR